MLFSVAVSRERAVVASALIALLIAALSQQLYHSFTFVDSLQSSKEQQTIDSYLVHNTKPLKNELLDDAFGSCLMLKEDNDLLPEWLAYHYTALPLRFLVVGSDVGNTQDPTSILNLWKETTDLQYTLLRVANIYNATLKLTDKGDEKERAHHAFVSRQKAFVTACSKLLKEKGVHWTTYIDSDEFVILNRLGRDDKDMKMDETAYQIRKDLPPLDSNATVLHVIKHLELTNRIGSCYSLPRLIVGALENATCPNAVSVTEMARQRYNYQSMSTLRFVQHARKGDFASSKFGKVMMDLSQITKETLDTVPRNIHRPYKSHCGPGVVHFPNAFVFLNHYIGSWERYSSRVDGRRNRDVWEARAYYNHGALCDKAIHTWLPRFIALVGEERAKCLLANDDGVESRRVLD